MPPSFVGLHLTSALHQHAGDDLKAVCHPVLDFLQQHRLVANEIILEAGLGARIRHVGDGEKQADIRVMPRD